jgi:CRISPR-associated protein Cas5d
MFDINENIHMKNYPVCFEIAGPAAMFARPDTGAAPISYPLPTWSACKAMFESVARGFFADRADPAAFFCPAAVEIWMPVRFEKYVVNYRGPLRKSAQINKDASYQLPATILADVCYRVTGECIAIAGTRQGGVNAAHAMQEMFNRRLKKGVSKYAPCLGWKEFLPTYFGPYRDHPIAEASPSLQSDLHLAIPAFLLSMWDAPVRGAYQPSFRELNVQGGMLRFPVTTVVNGKLHFGEMPNVN